MFHPQLAWFPLSLLPSSRPPKHISDIRLSAFSPHINDDDTSEMIQTYGVTPVAAEPSTGVVGEETALLGGERDTSIKTVHGREGHATIVSCISNLSNTIIGSGVY